MLADRLHLVDCSDLRAVAQSQRLGELGAAIGVERNVIAGAGDGDVGGGRIDGVGPERLQVGHDAIGGGPLGGMDRPDPSVTEVAIGEAVEVEHLL